MKIKYNIVVTLLLLAYSLPGLFLASHISFLENLLGPVNVGPLVAGAFIQALLFFILFPKLDLFNRKGNVRPAGNRFGINLIVFIYVACSLYVATVELNVFMEFSGHNDRNSLYQIYRELVEVHPIEKIKTFIAVIAIYLVMSGSARLALGSCITISAIDFGFGNRGFVFYTLIIIIFAYMPSMTTWRNNRFIYFCLCTFLFLILFRTYIFSGDSEISGIDHLLAVLGEFVFTSSTPLFVNQVGAQGDIEKMLVQLLGLDKIFGMRTMWVGEIVQQELALPIGLACGPLCEAYYYAPDTLSFILSIVGIAILYAMFVWLSVKSAPPQERISIITVQVLLMRDLIRTGLVVSFSTLVLWTLIALTLNRIFFSRKKSEFSGST
jgi:hypothetical protein